MPSLSNDPSPKNAEATATNNTGPAAATTSAAVAVAPKQTTTFVLVLFLSVMLIWSGIHQAFQVNPNTWGGGGGSGNAQHPTRIDILKIVDEEAVAPQNVGGGGGDGNNDTTGVGDNVVASGQPSGDAGAAGSGGATLAGGAQGGDDAAAGTTPTVAISDAEASKYLYPGCFSSVLGKKCTDTLWSHCNSGGADKCRWKPSVCNFNNNDCYRLTELFPNRTFLFRGDSTLREQFSVWSFYCCPWAAPIRKADTNMTNRETVARHHPELGLKSFFHFDYLFDHLLQPVPNLPSNQSIDAVVVGLGMYQAKAITTNQSDQQSLEEIERFKIKKVVESICDYHKAKVGFFVGGWMECVAMKKHKAKTVRQNYGVCHASAKIVSQLNRMVKSHLSMQAPRKDGCYVHYIPAMKCRGQKHTCTGDGVHARSNGMYGNTKFQLLFNAAKALFKTAPPGL